MTDNIFDEYVDLKDICERMMTAYSTITDLELEESLTSEQKARLRAIATDLYVMLSPIVIRKCDLAIKLSEMAKEAERMSVKKEKVNGIMNEAMGLERRSQCIKNAIDLLNRANDSPEIQLCIDVLRNEFSRLTQQIDDLFQRYVGQEVKE